MNIGLLASGGLGAEMLQHLSAKEDISFVMTDKRSDLIIQYCEEYDIPLFIGNPREGRCTSFISNKQIEVLLSVNYLFLIEKDLIELPSKFAVNVHGSLLPKYRGRTPHVWAIINNEKETGITAHLIDSDCDTGAIIKQARVPIEPEDTGAAILEKFNVLYPRVLDQVLSDIKENRVQPITQDNSRATYFGKRTPADGNIKWEWHRERIKNWIRAQAPPYPGAFSYYKEAKVVFKSSVYSDMGFTQEQPNGLILDNDPLVVKTPNGALRLEVEETSKIVTFKTGECFISKKSK